MISRDSAPGSGGSVGKTEVAKTDLVSSTSVLECATRPVFD